MLDRNEEEEFFGAEGEKDKSTPAPVKRKRKEEEVEEPLKKQFKLKQEEDIFLDASGEIIEEKFEEEEGEAAAAVENVQHKQIIDLLSDSDGDEGEVSPSTASPPVPAARAGPVIVQENNVIKKLTDEEDVCVSVTLRRGRKGLVSHYKNASVDYKDIYKLKPGVWLNDEITNFYMTLLEDRAENDQSLPKIHYFNTFFYETLRNQGYAKVGQGTQKKRVSIFEKDLVFVPSSICTQRLGQAYIPHSSLSSSTDYLGSIISDILSA